MGFYRRHHSQKKDQKTIMLISSLYLAHRVKERLEDEYPNRTFIIEWFGKEAILSSKEGNDGIIKAQARNLLDEEKAILHGGSSLRKGK